MITPSLQPALSALNPEQDNPRESDAVVCFHGHNISQLPAEVLPGITCYLSMREVLVLGHVCRDLRSRLGVCGVISNIVNYLSLPENKKLSIHQTLTGNRSLIEHLRNNPVGYCKSFPIQHSPAIYVKYASHFREQTVKASSVTLVQIGRIDVLNDFLSYKLNDQHNCLIQNGPDNKQLHIWTNQEDGCWKKEGMVSHESFFAEYHQHGADILFIDGWEGGKNLLSVVERNEFGSWDVTQKLCLNDISTLQGIYKVVQMHFAENQQVLFCELENFNFKGCELLIFTVDADGRWLIKGQFKLGNYENAFQFRFSHDCCHIVVFTGSMIFFVSRQDDESWIKTGEFKSKSSHDKNNLQFSADDHHFVAWGEVLQQRYHKRSLRKEIHVIVASRDDQGHWSKVLRIDRVCDLTTQQPSPYARFSPDGNQLFVCVNNELIFLSRHEGQWVSSTHRLQPWDGSRCKILTTMNPSLLMVTSDKMAWIYGVDAHGVWVRQHKFPCLPDKLSPIISPDGDTAICIQGQFDLEYYQYTDPWGVDLWSRSYSGQWIKQMIDIPASQAEFSPDGCLVALASSSQLILLGQTEERLWREKGRQQFDHCVKKIGFSSCGRSMSVSCQKEECDVVTFWQIVSS